MASTALVSRLLSVPFINHLIHQPFNSKAETKACPYHRNCNSACSVSFVKTHLCTIHAKILPLDESLLCFGTKGFSFLFHSRNWRENDLKSSSDPKLSVPKGSICQIPFLQSDRVFYPGEWLSSGEVCFLCVFCMCQHKDR